MQHTALSNACLRLSGNALIDRAPKCCSASVPTRRCRVGSRKWLTILPRAALTPQEHEEYEALIPRRQFHSHSSSWRSSAFGSPEERLEDFAVSIRER